MIVTSGLHDFTSSRHVAAGNLAIESPAAFLAAVLDDHPDVMAAPLHLATHRRDVATVGEVLDELRGPAGGVRGGVARRCGSL